ncbi:MAG: SLBB domain-containing protein [candidate division NC10 bacterium]|nr:SLBB domain-containing protein [candidate division NC10 bacterium]
MISTETPQILVGFSDVGPGVDVASLRILVNGEDKTRLFAVSASGASYQVTAQDRLRQGENIVVATVKNRAGLTGTAAAAFTVDTAAAQGPGGSPRSPIEVGFFAPPIVSQDAFQAPPTVISRDLAQFGYSLFQGPASTFAPVTDVPVGPDYVVGPGDNLVLYMWGLVENHFNLPVDRKGEIFVPKVGVLPVGGLSFSEAEQLMQRRLAAYYSGFQTRLAMGELRTVNVYVVGEVVRPGAYTLSALATMSNALYAAGGPTKLGSLRGIQLLRNSQLVSTMDLYDFLLRGDKSRDRRLQSGDTIFVPPIGPVAGVAGAVKRPAIYEMTGPMRVSDLLAMAGGATPLAYLKRVQLERVEENARKVILDLDLSAFYSRADRLHNIPLQDGDLVKVLPIDSRLYNTVTLDGFVKHPGEYEFRPGLKVSEIASRDRVLPEAFLERVEVVRQRPDYTREVLALDLRKAWEGEAGHDLELKPLDKVVIRSEFKSTETVTLGGEVMRPGTYAIQKGERLSSVIRRAGGYTADAYLKGAVFTRLRVKEEEQKRLEEFIRGQEAALLTQAAATSEGLSSLSAGGAKDEGSLQAQALAQRREMLRVLASQVVLGRVVVHLDDPAKMAGTAEDILLENADTLTIPKKPSSVLVVGAVRNPTAILHKEGESAEYYINRAGGFSKQADKKEAYIVRADGGAVTSFTKLRTLEPGDTIVAPADTDPKIRALPLTRDVATILGQFALSIGVIAALF